MTNCQVITVMNMKGGVGKTTISAHISWALSQEKNRNGQPINVLMIDYDPQFNLSQMFFKDEKEYYEMEDEKKTIYNVLVENYDDINPYHIQKYSEIDPPNSNDILKRIYKLTEKNGNLDIIISSLHMMYLAIGQGAARNKSMEKRFSKFIEKSKKNYDLIIIDCHPAGSLFTKTALFNSDFVLIPVVPSYYAARGITLMMKFIDHTKNSGCVSKPIIIFNGVKEQLSAEEGEIRGNPRFSKYCIKENIKYSNLFKYPSYPSEKKKFIWEIDENSGDSPEKKEVLKNLSDVVKSLREKIEI